MPGDRFCLGRIVDLGLRRAALEVSCRELLEFGVACVVENTAVDNLCTQSACPKGRRRLAHFAPARGGKQDDCFACQVVRLEERVDNRRRHVPPDGKSQKDDVVVFDVLDSGGYGRTAGGVGRLECATALFVAPVKVGACVWIGGQKLERLDYLIYRLRNASTECRTNRTASRS